MKRRSSYTRYIFLLSLLLLACNNLDEMPETMDKKTVMVPFSIKIGSEAVVTRAENPSSSPIIAGEACEADHLRIFVFKKTAIPNSGESETFVYEKEGVVEKQPYASGSDRMRYATGYFEGEVNATYRIVGYAYKASEEKYLDFSGITTSGKTFTTATIGINKTDGTYYTPEFFSGTISDDPTLRTKRVTITDGTKIQLQGSLFRGVGQINVKVTNIPGDVTKLGLVMDRYSIKNGMIDPTYFIYTYFSKESTMERIIVDETDQIVADTEIPANGRTAILTENMLRLGDGITDSAIDNGGSLLYIDATTAGGTTTRYLVQCHDKMMEDPFTPVLYEYLIISSRFVIPTNWRMTISGDFSKLQHGTLKMEINDITANGFFAGMME